MSLEPIRVRYYNLSASVRVRHFFIRTVNGCNREAGYVEGESLRAEDQRRASGLGGDRRFNQGNRIYDDETTHLKTPHFKIRPSPNSNQNHSDTNGGKRL